MGFGFDCMSNRSHTTGRLCTGLQFMENRNRTSRRYGCAEIAISSNESSIPRGGGQGVISLVRSLCTSMQWIIEYLMRRIKSYPASVLFITLMPPFSHVSQSQSNPLTCGVVTTSPNLLSPPLMYGHRPHPKCSGGKAIPPMLLRCTHINSVSPKI